MYQDQDTEEAESSAHTSTTPLRQTRKLIDLNHPNKNFITPNRPALALELNEARKAYFGMAKKTAKDVVEDMKKADNEVIDSLQLIQAAINEKKAIPPEIMDMACKNVKKREAAFSKMELTKTFDVEVKKEIDQMLLDSKF